MATKPPYIIDQRLKGNPHWDLSTQRINYKDGTAADSTLYNVFVNNETYKRTYSSQSTKPWPKGIPPMWTNQVRNHWRMPKDSASGFVVWTPGGAWPQVSTRVITSTGGYGHVFKPPVWQLSTVEYPDKDALDNSIRNELNDAFNAAVALAEAKKSVDGVAKRISTLGQVAFDLLRKRPDLAMKRLGYPKKKRLSSARRRSLKREIVDPNFRQFASDWLELQYGVLPLLNDIHNGIESAKKSMDVGGFIKSTKKVKKKLSKQYTSPSNIDGGTGVHYETHEYTTRCSYTCEYVVHDPYLKRLSETGVLNPSLVLWEIVPFSFVIDWFLPIGDFLSALTSNFGVTVKGCLYTEKYTGTRSITSTLRGASPVDYASGTGYLESSSQNYTRTNVAFPTAKFPNFKNPLSTVHCANALALLTAIFTDVKIRK